MNFKKASIVFIILLVLAGAAFLIFNQKNEEQIPQIPQTSEEVLVALGSSLTKASNLSSDKQGENEDYSFAVGTKIVSLYGYLKKSEPDLTVVNLASPGAEMKDILERQLPQALTYQPKYITMDPGADIVTKNSVKDFKENLSEIIRKISNQTTVFLFTYPNFVKMRTVAYDSCQENKIGVNLENLKESNILAFNQAMKEVVAGKNNVILADIYGLLEPADISDYDCLHLNVSGEEKIAAAFIEMLAAQR